MPKETDKAPIRISLNEDHLQILLAGGVIRGDGVEICLQDIGLDRISDLVSDSLKSSLMIKSAWKV